MRHEAEMLMHLMRFQPSHSGHTGMPLFIQVPFFVLETQTDQLVCRRKHPLPAMPEASIVAAFGKPPLACVENEGARSKAARHSSTVNCRRPARRCKRATSRSSHVGVRSRVRFPTLEDSAL